jgi:hypothetical protein
MGFAEVDFFIEFRKVELYSHWFGAEVADEEVRALVDAALHVVCAYLSCLDGWMDGCGGCFSRLFARRSVRG